MIIVEGPDNAGKTTLVTSLVQGGRPLIKRERFKPGQEETIGLSYLKALIPRDGDRLAHGAGVIDRLLASEIIYGDLFRGGHRVGDGEHLAIVNMLCAYDADVVFCDPGDAAIKASWTEREQLYEQGLEIAKAYRLRLPKIFHPLVPIRYDWTRRAKAVAPMQFESRPALAGELEWWSANPYGAGSLHHPPILFVGESPSPRMKTRVPFSNGPAGDFLAWAIRAAERLSGARIIGRSYITNAQKGTERDAALLREEIRFLQPRIIISLGGIAAKMLEYLQPQARMQAMPHPMYWRRFKFNERHEYPKMLAKAAVVHSQRIVP